LKSDKKKDNANCKHNSASELKGYKIGVEQRGRFGVDYDE
jgi:hypothetical protein